MTLRGSTTRLAARILALLAASSTPGLCAAAAEAPLDAYVATLDTAGLENAPMLQAALRGAETRLAAAAPPRPGCAAALGAQRYATLHGDLAQARQALGDRGGARAAWQAAIDCAPRRPRLRMQLAAAQLALGEFAAADASLARARELQAVDPDAAPGVELEIEQLHARIDYAAARWSAAATRAARIVALLRSEQDAARLAEGAARAPRTLPPQPAEDDGDDIVVTFWRILEQLARGRGGQPPDAAQRVTPGLDGRWPEPLWQHLQGRLDERALVAAIRAVDSPRRRREMSCEALYYTAQQAFAEGRDEFARRRLARVVNLKVPYLEEHELALAELARLRRAP